MSTHDTPRDDRDAPSKATAVAPDPDRPSWRTMGDRGATNRGASETIGFVVVFSIIITSVGILYVTGFDSIGDMRQGEQLKNGERTFQVLDRNFDDIQRREAPTRSAEVNLNGGSLAVTDESRVEVNVSGNVQFNESIPLGSLTYSLGNRHIAYENGAVFRRNPKTSSVLRDPRLVCRDDVAIISVVTVRSPNTSVGGTNVVTVTAVRNQSRILLPETRPANETTRVNVTFFSKNDAGWTRYLDQEADAWTDKEGDGSYVCEGVERVYVRQTVLQLRFRN